MRKIIFTILFVMVASPVFACRGDFQCPGTEVCIPDAGGIDGVCVDIGR